MRNLLRRLSLKRNTLSPHSGWELCLCEVTFRRDGGRPLISPRPNGALSHAEAQERISKDPNLMYGGLYLVKRSQTGWSIAPHAYENGKLVFSAPDRSCVVSLRCPKVPRHYAGPPPRFGGLGL